VLCIHSFETRAKRRPPQDEVSFNASLNSRIAFERPNLAPVALADRGGIEPVAASPTARR